MGAIIARIQNEPVLVTTLVGALLNLAIVFGVSLQDDQKTAILVVLDAALALFVRGQVTPA